MSNGQHRIPSGIHEHQVVVDLNQLDEVLAIIKSIPVTWSSVEKSKVLGLALLSLDRVSVPRGYTDANAHSKLDLLISYLSDQFKKRTGDTLEIGKNRIVGPIVGSPYVGGGEGIPTPYVAGGDGIPAPYVGGGLTGVPYPYTGAGNPPYVGGGLTGVPYTGAGNPPYVGGGLPGIQPLPLNGSLPKRTAPPAKEIGVGILDTRIFAHPDLAGRYLASHGTLASEILARPPDQEAHATFIAGVVLERAPNANLIVDHVLNESDVATSSWKVATKMVSFADAGVKVLNISFGAATDDDEPPLVLKRAVERLQNKITIVAAAGNHGPETRKIWPAALHETHSNVVAVGAGGPDRSGDFVSAEFSPDAKWVGLIAPGENIYSTYKASGYATWSGTSFAAAAVSGAIARLMEATDMSAKECAAWLMQPPSKRTENGVSALMGDIGPRTPAALG